MAVRYNPDKSLSVTKDGAAQRENLCKYMSINLLGAGPQQLTTSGLICPRGPPDQWGSVGVSFKQPVSYNIIEIMVNPQKYDLPLDRLKNINIVGAYIGIIPEMLSGKLVRCI